MSLKKISLATAIIGLIMIILLSYNLEPKKSDISSLDSKDIGKFVKIAGEVTSAKSGETSFFEVSDGTGGISVVYFGKIDISKGAEIEVIGKVDEYKGILELKADKITSIGS
jgi:RecJ-like exonuclease